MDPKVFTAGGEIDDTSTGLAYLQIELLATMYTISSCGCG